MLMIAPLIARGKAARVARSLISPRNLRKLRGGGCACYYCCKCVQVDRFLVEDARKGKMSCGKTRQERHFFNYTHVDALCATIFLLFFYLHQARCLEIRNCERCIALFIFFFFGRTMNHLSRCVGGY